MIMFIIIIIIILNFFLFRHPMRLRTFILHN